MPKNKGTMRAFFMCLKINFVLILFSFFKNKYLKSLFLDGKILQVIFKNRKGGTKK